MKIDEFYSPFYALILISIKSNPETVEINKSLCLVLSDSVFQIFLKLASIILHIQYIHFLWQHQLYLKYRGKFKMSENRVNNAWHLWIISGLIIPEVNNYVLLQASSIISYVPLLDHFMVFLISSYNRFYLLVYST